MTNQSKVAPVEAQAVPTKEQALDMIGELEAVRTLNAPEGYILTSGLAMLRQFIENSHPTPAAADLHQQIMNIPVGTPGWSGNDLLLYKEGHRDARHAAAQLVAASPAAAAGVPTLTERQIEQVWFDNARDGLMRYGQFFAAARAMLVSPVAVPGKKDNEA